MAAFVEAPVEWSEWLGDLKFPERTDQKLQELMDRNTEGLLSEAERADLESLVELSEQLSLVRGEALHLLGRKPL